MNIAQIAQKAEKLFSDNSPAILTAIGVTGALTTAYLTGKASFKAAKVIEEAQYIENVKGDHNPLMKREKVKLVWHLYVPAVGFGVVTVVSIIGANRIGTRRTAAMAAAYTLSERAFDEYKNKVVEKIGAGKERAVRDDLAQDRVNRAAEHQTVIVHADSTKVLCHDAFSNQFFHSDMQTIRKAVNDVNAQVIHSDFATVNDFYHAIDPQEIELKPTSVSGDLGWNTDKMLEIDPTTVLHDDATPCLSINFATVPIRDPWRFC